MKLLKISVLFLFMSSPLYANEVVVTWVVKNASFTPVQIGNMKDIGIKSHGQPVLITRLTQSDWDLNDSYLTTSTTTKPENIALLLLEMQGKIQKLYSYSIESDYDSRLGGMVTYVTEPTIYMDYKAPSGVKISPKGK